VLRRIPLFDPDVTVNLLDQFHLESNVIVGPGRYLCNPVEKNNEGHPVSPMSTWRDTRSSMPHWVIFIFWKTSSESIRI
jgi:hypothetical protein